MRCNTCGNEIADGSLSCPFCGAPFSTGQQYTNGQIPYMNGQYTDTSGLNPYMNGQYSSANGLNPYMNGQYSNANGLNPYMQQPDANPYIPAGNNPYIQPEYNPYIPTGYNGPGVQEYGVSAKPKKKTGKLIAIIISCVVLLAGLGVGAYFLFFNKTLSPTDVVEKYLDAMIDCDMSKASEYFLPKTNEYHQKVFDSAMELKKHYITLSYSDVKEDGNLTAAETEKLNYSLNELYNISCTKFVFVSLTLSSVSSDHSKDETESGRLIVGQYDDKWYVICSEDTPIEVIPPQEVADRFMEAFESLDVQKMLKQIHVSMKNSSTFDDFSSIEELGKMGIKLSVSGGKEISMSDSDIGSYKEELLDKHGLAVDDVKTFDYTITLSFMGQSNSSDLKLIIGKIDGKWYVIEY